MAEEDQWQHIAQRTSRKINVAWWLQVLSTPLLIVSLMIACALLILRRELDHVPVMSVLYGALGVLLLTVAVCWFVARRQFENKQQSLVRLESSMRMRNALTAADHGVIAWPKVPALINDGVQWHWKRLLTPILSAVLIIACGWIIPIHAKSDSGLPSEQPTAWNELDASLDQLDHQEIVQDEYIKEMREKLEKLREQSPDEWFSHSSLEATDHLQQSHQAEQQNLQTHLQRAERALNTLQSQAGKMNSTQQKRLLNEYNQAVKKMQQGGMQPNPKLLEQLKKLDPSQLNQLSPEQLDQIRENMRRHAKGLDGDGQKKQPGEGDDDWMNESEGEGDGEEKGNQPGRGGIDRGPGTAPRVLGQAHDDTGTGKHEGLKSGDLSQALPGDLLQTSDAKHDVDQTSRGPIAGGSASGKGEGGDRVWKNSLMPNEKKAIKKFFE